MNPLAVAALATALVLWDGRVAGQRLRHLRIGPRPGRSDPPDPATPTTGALVIGTAAAGGLGWAVAGFTAAFVLGAATAVLLVVIRRRGVAAEVRVEPVTALAGAWELLAVCLSAGLPVATAIPAATGGLTGRIGRRLREVAGLLDLGADPTEAWAAADQEPALAVFARSAARSAATGTGLAQIATAEAARIRAELGDRAQAGAQRAGVLITAPLGLCFLPAFLALGIAPVLVGLAGDALANW